MRSTIEIIIAVKECSHVEFEELRLALTALSSISQFVNSQIPHGMKPKKLGTIQTIDMETGEVINETRNAMTLLPPPEGTCIECAVDHSWNQPHNQQSLYYQMSFHSKNGRWPTWTDAMAHCPDNVKKIWREKLREMVETGQKIPSDLCDDVPNGGRPA